MLYDICSDSRHSRSVLAGRGLASSRQAPHSLPTQAYLLKHIFTGTESCGVCFPATHINLGTRPYAQTHKRIRDTV